MPWARASGLHRHLECSASSWLPRFDRGAWHPGYLEPQSLIRHPAGGKNDSDTAEWGVQMHLAKENHPTAADPWLSWMEPHRERLWPARLGRHEVAWSYDCNTGGVECWEPHADEPEPNGWKERRPPGCVVGTTDWWGRLPGGELWVDDLKTGWPVPGLTTPQMLMYALVAARFAGQDSVRVSVTHWRRGLGGEPPDRRWRQIGPATLEVFEDEVRAAWVRTRKSKTPVVGPWCRWCPSLPKCPAQQTEQETEDGQ